MSYNSSWSSSRDYERTFDSQHNSQTTLRDSKWYEQKCRESLRESLQTVAETNEVGQKTAEQLNQQTGNHGIWITRIGLSPREI